MNYDVSCLILGRITEKGMSSILRRPRQTRKVSVRKVSQGF